MTASQVREVFSRLLRVPAPSPERIAEGVTRVLWRKEAARIDKWQGRRHIPTAPLTAG